MATANTASEPLTASMPLIMQPNNGNHEEIKVLWALSAGLKVLAMLTMALVLVLASALLLANSAERANTLHTIWSCHRYHCPQSEKITASGTSILEKQNNI